MKLIDIVAGCFGTARRLMFAAEGAPPPPNEMAGYHFVEFRESDLESHGLFRERDRPVWFPRRLQDGHRLFGWRDQAGEAAGYLWFSTSSQPPVPWTLGLKLRLRGGETYVWDCRTAEPHRRRHLYRGGLVRLRGLAAAEGMRRVFIDCDPGNIASIRAIERAGFLRQSEASVRRFGGNYLVRDATGRIRLLRGEVESGQILG
jgi:hypothetical protein